jgi:cytoskeleton protein RodZ
MPLISVESLMSDQEINTPLDLASEAGEVNNLIQTPGAKLAAARQERGWSIEQVASQLNLAVRQVHAIESDDYASLPGMPIARGFIRSYAKLLKVDATPLLAMIPGETAAAKENLAPLRNLSAPFAETRLPSMMGRQGFSGRWVVGLLVVALLVGGASMVWQPEKMAGVLTSFTSATAKSAATVSAPAPASVPDAASAMADTMMLETASAGSTTGIPSTEPDAAKKEKTVPPAAAVAPVAAAAATTALAAVQNVSEPDDALILKVHQDSWIEIKRPDNTVVFSGLIQAGKTETVKLPGPVSLVVGNAAGVEATLRSKPLGFKSNTANNVARLNLK